MYKKHAPCSVIIWPPTSRLSNMQVRNMAERNISCTKLTDHQSSSSPLTFTPEILTSGQLQTCKILLLSSNGIWDNTTKCPVQANSDWRFFVFLMLHLLRSTMGFDQCFLSLLSYIHTLGSPQRLITIESWFNDWTHYGNFSAAGGRCTDVYFVTVLWTS